eukprot:m51a1_g8938 hypothetical protein (2210) ;mRNA; f:925872-934549
MRCLLSVLTTVAALCTYVSIPAYGDADFMWRVETAVNGSTDPEHVSLRLFTLPDYFLCAKDETGSAVAISMPVQGLSDVGLVSLINEGRYLSVSNAISGFCSSFLPGLDVVLDGFPAAKENATWAPVDVSTVGIRHGMYYTPNEPYLHQCGNQLMATGLDTTDPLFISIRPASDMGKYVCFDGVVASLQSPTGIEKNCTFVIKRVKEINGAVEILHPATGLSLYPCPQMTTDTSRVISPSFYGITLDDQNFGLDGGLLAQLIRNRDFEVQGRGNLGDSQQPRSIPVPTDMRPWTSTSTPEGAATVGLTTATHPFDTNPVALSVAATAAATVLLKNPGYWGIAVALGMSYKGSVRAKSSCAWSASAVLRDTTGDVSTTWTQSIAAGDWAKVEFTLTGQKTSTSVNFVFGVAVTGACTVWLDSFSLIPADAVLGLFRKDVHAALAALRPSFVQFPWGKTLEGTSADTRWSFGGTVGEADARPGHYSSAWGSWSTDGLGLHEFLLLAESLAAHPILSLFAGRVVHMIEYANGAATTTYGAMRKKNGHEASFDVREVQIGSGFDSPMTDYARFFNPALKAIAAAFPHIKVTASSFLSAQNPCLSNRTYCTAWTDRLEQTPTQMVLATRKYNDCDRSLPLVAISNTAQSAFAASLTTAAAEAVFLVGAERNADAVARYSLVPTLRNNNAAPTGVALVGLDSARTYLLPAYHVHRMAAAVPCAHTLPTSVASDKFATACRTAAGDVVFKAANWADAPLIATFNLPGAALLPTSVSVTVLAGPSPTSGGADDVVPTTLEVPGARKVTVPLPRYAVAVVVFRGALPNGTEGSSSSGAAADACDTKDNAICRNCLRDSRCGWCEGLAKCITWQDSDVTPDICRNKDWRINTCAAAAANNDGTNTAAIIGGAVGGGGFALVVVAVVVVVVVVAHRRDKNAVPNIPIDNASVGFVPTMSTAFDASGGALSGSALATTIASPLGGTSSGSSTPPRVELGVLTSVNSSSLHLQLTPDIMAPMQQFQLPPAFGAAAVPLVLPPPPSEPVVYSGGASSVESGANARTPLLQAYYPVSAPTMALRHCAADEGQAYVSVPLYGDGDFLWREEAAANGSTDPTHVSLRVLTFPDYFLCAADESGTSVFIRNTLPLSLCTFRKVPGLSDVGLVSFVNEGRYLTVSSGITGKCSGLAGGLDVVLDGFPAAKENATWAPVDSSAVGLRYGLYYTTPVACVHNCGGQVTITQTWMSPPDPAWHWVFEKASSGLDTSDALSVSIRSGSDMDKYLCFDGQRASLVPSAAAVERNCSFVFQRDLEEKNGGVVIHHAATGFNLFPCTATTTDTCSNVAASAICGTRNANRTTRWTLTRPAVATATNISASSTAARAISPSFYGITLDDSNFGLDGGLYAQLIRNRDFEVQGRGNFGDGQQPRSIPVPTDMRPWTASATPEGAATVALTTATHPFDTNPVALSVAATAAATVQLTNPGYWGIAVALGTSYKGSVRAKSSCAWSASAVLRDTTGDVSTTWTQSISASDAWAKVEFTLTGQKTSTSANFVFGVGVTSACTVWLDSFSLIPADAVLGLFRKDVHAALAALRPSFVQFPWGRTLEGTSADTRWSFGGTVGEADARPGHYSSAWGSWSTDGLGLHEFLLLAESLAAQPILSLFAGRVVHMVEYANGAASTTYGAMRKKSGHEASFNVREVQIGSGFDSPMSDYARFFNPALKAIAAAFPDIRITASSFYTAQNPCISNRTYCTTWNDRLEVSNVAIASRHLDSYDRSLPLVSVSSSLPSSAAATVTSAATEAALVVGMERNADAVARYSLVSTLRNNNVAPTGVALVALDSARAVLLPSYHVHRMAAAQQCTHTLPTAAASDKYAQACRTAAGDVVFMAANVADAPLIATFALTGRTLLPTSVSVTVLAGASSTSGNAGDAVAATWTTAGARKVSVPLVRYAVAVVVFKSALPNGTDVSSSAASSLADQCGRLSVCRWCLDVQGCGWCDGLRRCYAAADAAGDAPEACRDHDWRYQSCDDTGGGNNDNTAAIVGGAVGGGGFALVVVAAVIIVVVVTRRRGGAKSVPNIPIDNISVGFVPTMSTAFDASLSPGASANGAMLGTGVFGTGSSFNMSPLGGASSGASSTSTPPRPDLGVLGSVGAQPLQLSTDLMLSSLQQMPLAPVFPSIALALPPPPALEPSQMSSAGGSSSLESGGGGGARQDQQQQASQ